MFPVYIASIDISGALFNDALLLARNIVIKAREICKYRSYVNSYVPVYNFFIHFWCCYNLVTAACQY